MLILAIDLGEFNTLAGREAGNGSPESSETKRLVGVAFWI